MSKNQKQSSLTAFFTPSASQSQTQDDNINVNVQVIEHGESHIECGSSSVPTPPVLSSPPELASSWLEIPKDRLARDAYFREGSYRDVCETYPKTKISGKQRSFQPAWLSDRNWLEYNRAKDATFCFPCRAFGKTVHDPTFQTLGFRQWNRALETNRGFDKHAKSGEHQKNMMAWVEFKKNKPIDVTINEERQRLLELGNKERQSRYEVLPILFDVTNTLARLRLPFRGHDESENSNNCGVFLETIDLVGRWNSDLSNHLKKSKENPKSYPSYTSPSSQNQMISGSADFVRKEIVSGIKQSGYFAVCLDTTPDASRKDQLSVIVRYIDSRGDINEDLLDMVHSEDMTAAGLFTALETTMMKFELDMKKIRGQGYDGCSTMSGCYSGVQARVHAVSESAYFVHCFAHRLNLVVVDTCCQNTIIRNFFGLVGSLYDFIEGSTKRHSAFQSVREQIEAQTGKGGTGSKTLHSLSSTRWSARVDNCKALMDNIIGVVTTLETISSGPEYDRKSAGEATALMKSIDFEFCLTLAVMADLLQLTNVVSKYLQSPQLNIPAAATQVQALVGEIESKRSDEQFQVYWEAAESMAQSIGVEHKEQRRRKVSKRIDEFWQNETTITGKDRLRVSLYFDGVDRLLTALKSRFSPTVMPLLSATECLIRPSKDKEALLQRLQEYYPQDLDKDGIKLEYRLFCRAVESGVHESLVDNIHSIYAFMLEKSWHEIYPNVARAYQLVLTLPVSSASCERSFSALKFVKNSLRTTMTQTRLSDLMVLSVRGNRVSSKTHLMSAADPVVDSFWNSMQRR